MRDDDNLQNIPSITPAMDEVALHRHKHRKVSAKAMDAEVAKSSAAQKFILSLLWVLVLGLGVGLFILHEQGKETKDLLGDARLRVQQLESRLSVTDENFTQSGAALQLTLKEQQKAIKLWESEIRKLWDVTNKRNKKDIAANKSQIAKQKTSTAKNSTAVKQNNESIRVFKEQLTALGGTVMQLDKALKGQDFSKFTDQLRILDQRFKNLVNQVDDVEHTLEAFDAYRLQVNQSLSSLERALNDVQKLLQERASAAVPVGQ